jgi:DNA polymerase
MAGAREALRAYESAVSTCERCALARSRSAVVFGAGDPAADLVLVGEAPGFHEDATGLPFVGQAGALLDRLLASIGLQRAGVYLATVIKCRPPGNRDPLPEEVAACETHLYRQLELVAPRVVVTFGNVATRLLTGEPHGITRIHGRERSVVLGGAPVVLYPLYHPAAALYTPTMLEVLERDFARLPALLAGAAPEPAPPLHAAASAGPTGTRETVQLGLF